MMPEMEITIQNLDELKEMVEDLQLTISELYKKIEKMNTFQPKIITKIVYVEK